MCISAYVNLTDLTTRHKVYQPMSITNNSGPNDNATCTADPIRGKALEFYIYQHTGYFIQMSWLYSLKPTELRHCLLGLKLKTIGSVGPKRQKILVT